MKKNIIFFFLIFIGLANYAYSFGGRLPSLKKVVKVYKEDEPTRKMAFVKFDNMSDIKDVEYLRADIPKVLYSHFHNKDYTITVSRNELKPKWKTQLNYDKRIYYYYIEDTISTSAGVEDSTKTDEDKSDSTDDTDNTQTTTTDNNSTSDDSNKDTDSTSDDETQNTDDQEMVFDPNKKYRRNPQTLSQWMEEKIKVEEKYFYKETLGSDKVKDKRLIFYFPDKDYYYIDARNSDFNPKYLVNNKKMQEFTIYDYNKDIRRLERVIFRETNDFKRKFVVQNQIMNIQNANLDKIVAELKEKDIDYAIYGQITKAEVSKPNDKMISSVLSKVNVRIYLIRVKNKQIEVIYNKMIEPFNIYNELSSIPNTVITSIENRPMIKNIRFQDNIGGSYVYLDDVFMGKTPLTISSYPKGDYKLKIWNKNAIIDYKSLSKNPNIIVEKDEFNEEKRAYIKINRAYQNTTINFDVQTNKSQGVIEIDASGGDRQTRLYVDAQLTSIFKQKTRLTMATGNYFLSFNNDPKYQVVRLIAPVKENMITKIHINYDEIKPLPKWQRNLFNHERNYKIFGITSGILGLTTIGLWIYTKDILSKISELEALKKTDTKHFESLTKQGSDTNIAYFTFLGSTLLMATLSVASKIALVRRDEYRIGLPDAKNKLYELEYIPINDKSKKKKEKK